MDRLVKSSERLIVALDVPSGAEAMALVKKLSPLGVTFKVGMELFYREGMAIVHAVQNQGAPVFLDLKLHDIPHTVERAAASLVSQGVTFFNVHAQGGFQMMRSAVAGAMKASREHGTAEPIIVGVTALTSISPAALKTDLKVNEPVEEYVSHLAHLCQEAALDGVVCSPQESRRMRKECGPGFVLVTPGIRPEGAEAGDQQRITTPAAAIREGSSFLVVGRPILQADDPRAAAERILHEMDHAAVPGGQ